MRTRIPLTTLAAVLAFATVAADHNEFSCEDRWTTYYPADAETAWYPAYVAFDEIHCDCGWSVWVYAETNGVDGVQRHDEWCAHAGYENGGADTIVF